MLLLLLEKGIGEDLLVRFTNLVEETRCERRELEGGEEVWWVGRHLDDVVLFLEVW
jgi:hypothetical protein